jgi:hypothetical protein
MFAGTLAFTKNPAYRPDESPAGHSVALLSSSLFASPTELILHGFVMGI